MVNIKATYLINAVRTYSNSFLDRSECWSSHYVTRMNGFIMVQFNVVNPCIACPTRVFASDSAFGTGHHPFWISLWSLLSPNFHDHIMKFFTLLELTAYAKFATSTIYLMAHKKFRKLMPILCKSSPVLSDNKPI